MSKAAKVNGGVMGGYCQNTQLRFDNFENIPTEFSSKAKPH